jgi:uncharacterized protein YecE (DUF72 family)
VDQPLDLGPVRRRDSALVYVGTCSWTDPTLVRDTDWYPKKTMTAAERLAFYASRFPIVEADSTYYRPPTRQLCDGWVERTPDGFRMNVKSYSLLTGHPTKPETLWPDVRDALVPEAQGKRSVYAYHLPADAVEEAWRRVLDALAPLAETDRLGAVLLQYPKWFTPKRANRDELIKVAERLGGLPACVEFRSPRWTAPDDVDRTVGLLADLGLTLVTLDAPKASGLRRVLAVTADRAVVRFHGRADDLWDARTTSAAERFKYLYSRRQLRPWVDRIDELVAGGATEVHALFNNCYEDYGVRNAADLVDLLAS